MILSSLSFPKNKSYSRNNHISFNKDYEDKKYAKIKDLKYSSSLKLMKTCINYSNSKLDLNLINSYKTKYVKIPIRNKENKIKNISIQTAFSNLFDNNKIFKTITARIEYLISKLKHNKSKLRFLLLEIDNFVNNLFNRNDLESSNNKISSFNNEIKDKLSISNNENLDKKNQYLEIKILKKKIDKLIEKKEEMENKFKIERMSYLFCLGESQKKIKELTKKLSIESIDKMPINELNKVLCFPNYSKLGTLRKKKQKIIPINLSKTELKNNNILRRNNSQQSDNDNINFKQMFETELKEYKCNRNKFKDINKNNTLDYEKEEERKILRNSKKLNEVNDIIELGKKYFEQHVPTIDFFKSKKNYLISHPKLNYIKDTNSDNSSIKVKLGGQLKSLPKQFANYKKVINSNKNSIIVFPSVLNETILKLEKSKNNKNLRNNESKYEDIHKSKIKSLN